MCAPAVPQSYLLLGEEQYLAMFAEAYVAAMYRMRLGGEFARFGWLVDVHIDTGAVSRIFVSSLSAFWPGMQALAGALLREAREQRLCARPLEPPSTGALALLQSLVSRRPSLVGCMHKLATLPTGAAEDSKSSLQPPLAAWTDDDTGPGDRSLGGKTFLADGA